MSYVNFVKKYKLEIAMILPLLLYILGFTVYPIIQTITLSFQDQYTKAFTLANYKEIIGKTEFKQAFFNTIALTFISLTLEMTAGLVIALILKRNFRGKGLLRSLMLVPMGVPTLVSGVAMTYIFGLNGYFNAFLQKLRIIELPVDWASGGFKTLLMVSIADMWKVTPLVILLLLAGLESIPDEVYEASNIDGATVWQTFKYVTLPLLKPSITMALILRAIDAFRIFELVLVLAGRATPVISTFAYDEYNNYANAYTSAAASTILLLIIAVFIVSYLKIGGTKEEQ
ncbi:binding-protein-dependent transport systems inner membrane component [Thermoanaerobacter mathranii subsp. mathranii str. A3]|jgi:trehalose transport system permease protein|uniref:Binding-protein-dependent transport systems inner membrane component n=3 Tax=Thermoanaerobacter TaxID=1754 RepID=D3T7W0_THEIA|nr:MULTISPECIES: sugar ABC transporter permease [Thermoanaerobacter]ADD02042.1 binding-protein-dependent transport systems inner membrane component [Thermoanaerobacter italicus Ab9]ADH60540.1 binding-protein-dependent transport systems inner membrane component [Thermoanaerobacter mathranii subsp. mathranii str. A3]MDP9750126.1 trehalose transport system permease protein [Thermoanaerobacter pentosaceus]